MRTCCEAFVAYDFKNTRTKFQGTSCFSFLNKFRNVKSTEFWGFVPNFAHKPFENYLELMRTCCDAFVVYDLTNKCTNFQGTSCSIVSSRNFESTEFFYPQFPHQGALRDHIEKQPISRVCRLYVPSFMKIGADGKWVN